MLILKIFRSEGVSSVFVVEAHVMDTSSLRRESNVDHKKVKFIKHSVVICLSSLAPSQILSLRSQTESHP
jgi:hypothetical protein